jgi:hypothetical protein
MSLDGDTLPYYSDFYIFIQWLTTIVSQAGGTYMQYLQEAEIVTISDADCDKVSIGAIHYSDLCAGVPEGGVGQCIVIVY